jgi:hypothetical protein
MSSATESKEQEGGDVDVIGGLFECKPGQKYPTPSPGNGGKSCRLQDVSQSLTQLSLSPLHRSRIL